MPKPRFEDKQYMVVTINSPEDSKPEELEVDNSPNEEADVAPKKWLVAVKGVLFKLLPSRDTLRTLRTPGGRKALLTFLGGYILLTLCLGYYWSSAPDAFDVIENRGRYIATEDNLVTGATTTAALLEVTRLLLEKNGGYISNDITPPGTFMDDMPSWEHGVLLQSQDMFTALWEEFSRTESQTQKDVDLTMAENRIMWEPDSWALPATESQYRDARRHIESYLLRLPETGEDSAQFYASADTLNVWLGMVEDRLDNLSQRLSASVGQSKISMDIAGNLSANESTYEYEEFIVKTPWNEVDNVYYESRGTAFALIHFLRAVEVDFADVLEEKNATVRLRQIIRELEATQRTVWSPMILNGSGFGIWANHSLVMASYLSRANTALIDLRELLAQD